MVTMLSYDWKEQLTLKSFNKALKPHGLRVLSFENGDSYEWVIASESSTLDQIVDGIISTERFKADEGEEESQFRDGLSKMLVSE